MTVIAVDGPAASGKGTLARKLAAHFGYDYLDTGKLYRAVGLAVLNAGQDPSDADAALAAAQSIDPARLDDPALSGDDAAAAASKVAAIGPVRAALKDFQLAFAGREPGAVLDGRDIGTVICPDAPAKLFVTATVEVRAERRHKELLSRGEDSIYARVLQELKERDERDTSRADAPLRPADDAQVLDTSAMTIEEAFAEALKIVEGRLA
ncbi:(d)CMP kinase [Hwanghaeella grinnelliae]|uniref:Cytidylate kinase n=1 Tax=Hwanghaeella grinnelliae TaxID=2500179 RepID=A0A437QN84_9PROT|nr:(d)CMP kinase [Hwanghaeella grinnelliae]RVU36001.1 (d)CMP kinase [Hwanghaeella grinnelliae]